MRDVDPADLVETIREGLLVLEPDLTVRFANADNGSAANFQRTDSGLGGRLVEGFAQQLGGRVERESGSRGTIVRLILPFSDSGSVGSKQPEAQGHIL